MSLFSRVDSDMFEARKQRDDLKVSTLGMLKSEVVKATKEPGAGPEASDELVIRVLRREVKKREEAAELFRSAGRAESAEKEQSEAHILRSYLPASLGEAELEAEVRGVIDDLQPSGPAAFGQVMKEASRRLAGRAEGAAVAQVARRLLAQG